MLRVFVGIELPESVRQALAAVREDHAAARWHEPEHLHLTLNFIGGVEEACVERIAAAMVDVPSPVFALSVQGVGYFGTSQRPSVLWAGLAHSVQLHQLQQRLAERLLPLGLPVEDRPYTPHITLARVKPDVPLQTFLQRHARLSIPAFLVEHISLFLSSRGEHGVRYQVIERFRLD